jgi:hypothetical protein
MPILAATCAIAVWFALRNRRAVRASAGPDRGGEMPDAAGWELITCSSFLGLGCMVWAAIPVAW